MKHKKNKKKSNALLYLIIIGILIYIAYGLFVSYAKAMEIQHAVVAQVEEKQRIEEMSVPELIVAYGGSQSVKIDKIAYCESRYNPNAINYNDGGKNKHSIGVLQFQEATFKEWSSKMGETLDYHSSLDQIKVARYMIEHGQAKQWTCAHITKVI